MRRRLYTILGDARPCMPTPRRASFIINEHRCMPFLSSAASQPLAPSRFITQVALALRPICARWRRRVSVVFADAHLPFGPVRLGNGLRYHRNSEMPVGAARRIRQARQQLGEDILWRGFVLAPPSLRSLCPVID